jgi:hypothetical protein
VNSHPSLAEVAIAKYLQVFIGGRNIEHVIAFGDLIASGWFPQAAKSSDREGEISARERHLSERRV